MYWITAIDLYGIEGVTEGHFVSTISNIFFFMSGFTSFAKYKSSIFGSSLLELLCITWRLQDRTQPWIYFTSPLKFSENIDWLKVLSRWNGYHIMTYMNSVWIGKGQREPHSWREQIELLGMNKRWEQYVLIDIWPHNIGWGQIRTILSSSPSPSPSLSSSSTSIHSWYLSRPSRPALVCFFQAGVLFAKRMQNFGIYWPIMAILLLIYALFGVLLHAKNFDGVPK